MAQFSEIANHAWKMGGEGKVDGFLYESTTINEQRVCNEMMLQVKTPVPEYYIQTPPCPLTSTEISVPLTEY